MPSMLLYPKMKILSLITHPHVASNPYEFHLSSEHKWRIFLSQGWENNDRIFIFGWTHMNTNSIFFQIHLFNLLLCTYCPCRCCWYDLTNETERPSLKRHSKVTFVFVPGGSVKHKNEHALCVCLSLCCMFTQEILSKHRKKDKCG